MYHILYVDDEKVLLDIGKLYLERHSQISVDTITSAREALALLDSTLYDAVVSDYQMPEMDGISFLKEVRKRFGNIPFILFTGRGREEVVIEAIDNGADFYVQKGGQSLPQFAELAHKITVAVQRRQALDALVRNEKDFESLVEYIPDAIYISDGERFIYVNTAFVRMVGAVSSDQLTGMSIYDRIHPDYHALIHRRVHLIHVEGKPSGLKDLVYLKTDGTPVDVESSAVPFQFHGQGAGLVILRDISIKKRAQEELRKLYGELENRVAGRTAELSQTQEAYRKANEKLNLLSSITRHDINNQITLLWGYLARLRKNLPDPASNEDLQKSITAAQNISSIIRFTKEYERIGVNAPVWQDLRILVDTAAAKVSPGTVRIKNDISSGTGIYADSLVIKVFYNLMDNAVRYGGKITTIRFMVEECDGDHIVVCEDDGDGIAAADKERIFERGFGRNTGMGLFLAREILSITGIIICETGVSGNGARFEIVVPKHAYQVNVNNHE